MSPAPNLDDYIDVAERLMDFTTRYPEGTLQTIDWSVENVDGHQFVVYRAAAYRTPDDPRPGHGTAWEPFPGQSSFTRNSELMNAETAAWGRAILACGLPAKRGLASAQEVRNRVAEHDAEAAPEPQQRRQVRKPLTKPTEPAIAAPSGPTGASDPDDDSGPVTETTITQIKTAYTQAKVTETRMRELIKEAGATVKPGPVGKSVSALTQDQGSLVLLTLRRIASALNDTTGDDD